MIIKIEDAASVPGGRAILLCDDEGNTLPSQIRTVVEAGVDELGTITVTFQIDGERVRFAE